MLYRPEIKESYDSVWGGTYDAHLGVKLKPEDTKDPPFFEWYDADETDYYTVMILGGDFSQEYFNWFYGFKLVLIGLVFVVFNWF